MSCFSFEIHIFGDQTLQLPLYLSKQIMNDYHLNSTGFKSTRIGLTMHGSSFEDRHLVWSHTKNSIKLNNTVNTCLIRLKIILYYSYSLNIYECLICQIYQ